MDQDEVRRVSEHICDWLDDHASFSFNALCRTIGADSGNMQRYRKERCFLEKHLGLIEAELVKVREYVPMLVNEKAVGGKLQEMLNDIARKLWPDSFESSANLHPEQGRYPGRLVDEGIIEYRLRMAEKK